MRIYYVSTTAWRRYPDRTASEHWEGLIPQVRDMGFDAIMTPPLSASQPGGMAPTWAGAQADMRGLSDALGAAPQCAEHDLAFMMDLLAEDMAADALEQWAERLGTWCAAGVTGYCCHRLHHLAAPEWKRLIRMVHEHHPDCVFIAWTPGLTWAQLAALKDCGFLYTFSSLPWWDFQSGWLLEEQQRLSQVAPCIAPLVDLDAPSMELPLVADQTAKARRLLWSAAFTGDGILMPQGTEDLLGPQEIAEANRWQASHAEAVGPMRLLTGPLSGLTGIFRPGEKAAVLLLNPGTQAARVDRGLLASRLPGRYALTASAPPVIEAGDYSLIPAARAASVKVPTGISLAKAGAPSPVEDARIAIERVAPQVDGGRFPVKRCLGQALKVEADVFMDGHSRLAVELLWKATDEAQWHRVAMRPLGNDRWQGEFAPERLGPHCYTVQAWHDAWASHCEALKKKRDAGQNVSLEIEEARMLMADALERVRDDLPDEATELAALLRELGQPQRVRPKARRELLLTGYTAQAPEVKAIPAADRRHIDLVLSENAAEKMQAVDAHAFAVTDRVYPLTVERREAGYASWYELFPRSQSTTPGTHGTFRDVQARLPYIRDMGFDVLYMPPIHPIGQTNRKGRNNALSANEGDPGSPYAIGSPEGGHDAVHPELGTIDDFRDLVRAAAEHNIEIAIDFAIQCSPDHPWLARHPEWFDWRADGSLRYAENPPKRYEDIVNPDFYLGGAPLWRALRDVVLFWVDQGVSLFRVDNPHTKPLPFWQWLIAEVRGAHPEVVFLSEAFTRPQMMYRLAKVGFSQSYTYFTWRHGKQELTDYLTELSTPPVADFFRPHFFVNTPDINPYFLHDAGRPGFLIRAALAATTSGLWGMYNGFELCEARSVPGKEEYQDSEKYELRSWDWNRPGNIVDEITRLNRMRRLNPALQTHLGIRFHHVDNDQILFFTKTTPEEDNIVLVAISLDPHATQSGTLDLPTWQWPRTGDSLRFEDLFNEGRFELRGNRQHIALTPERPFLIWRLLPATQT